MGVALSRQGYSELIFWHRESISRVENCCQHHPYCHIKSILRFQIFCDNFPTVTNGRGPMSSGSHFMDFLTPGIDFSGEKLSPGVVILTKMAKILDLEFFEYFPTVKKGRGRNGILCHQAAWRRHIEFVGISLICQKPLRNLVHSDILDSICASYPSI